MKKKPSQKPYSTTPIRKIRSYYKTLQKFWQDNVDLVKDKLPVPPRQGLIWDAVKKRWVLPEHSGRTVMDVQGKKRIRGTGTGAHETSVSRKRPPTSRRFFGRGRKGQAAGEYRRGR
tara:strand:- start:2237 stop:2587 length:351 start_codon:yes stop_codon:yes gene_type:complete